MSLQTRRERERAERERLIVTAARELAETEGWDAVTTRRLATEIEYSQPVLYSHFKNKGAIMAAVVVEGCADLAVELRAARCSADGPEQALASLQEAFGELRESVRPVAGDDNLESLTETFWSGLHGLLTLMRNGRLRREDHEQRLAILIRRFTN
jgi:AcrR family transcriptional regulator